MNHSDEGEKDRGNRLREEVGRDAGPAAIAEMGDVKGMVLAAGFGTRMGPLSRLKPKPLLPICGVPLIRFALAQMADSGIGEVVVNLHHLGDQIRGELGEGLGLVEERKGKQGETGEQGEKKVDESTAEAGPYGLKLFYSEEKEVIQGTGGGVKKVSRFFGNKTFVVTNGKIVSGLELWRVIKFHKEMGALATMVVRPADDPYAWGAVECDAEGWVQSVAGVHRQKNGKIVADRVPVRAFVFTGIHVLEPEFLDLLPEGPSCIVRDGYYKYLKQAGRIAGYVQREYWQDHSTPSRYLQGNLNVLHWESALYQNVDFPDFWGVDEGAEVSSRAAVIPPVRICRGATVAAGARIGPGAV